MKPFFTETQNLFERKVREELHKSHIHSFQGNNKKEAFIRPAIMHQNETSSYLWPCLHSIHMRSFMNWNLACLLCRIGGFTIFFISIICFTFDVRYLAWYQKTQRQNNLVLSLFIASLLVILFSVPGVLLQLFTCHRHCSPIYCRIEGFISYLAGCVCMLIYMVLSINRYLLLCQHNHSFLNRYSAALCWLVGIIWTLPPVFHFWISYVPEGHGFHCSINWRDQSLTSRFYVLLSFLTIYFIPLIILSVVNLRVHKILRKTYSSPDVTPFYPAFARRQKLFCFRQDTRFERIIYNRENNTICYIRKAADRRRFRVEYRFIQAIIFLVSTYIIAWTPYSIIAVLQLFHIEFVFQHGSLATMSAIIAKLSVILTPGVYLSIMHFRLFKKILL